MGKSGPLERAELANQIQGFWIPDRWDALEKNKPRYYTVEQGNNTGLKSSDKMAAQKKPNFALFTSSGLDFLSEELFTEMDILTEQTMLFVFRARIMQSIRCKMDYEN